MRWLITIAGNLLGLFVGDGSFAVVIVAWLTCVGVVPLLVPLPSASHGAVLFAGLAIVLAWSCLRPISRRTRGSIQPAVLPGDNAPKG